MTPMTLLAIWASVSASRSSLSHTERGTTRRSVFRELRSRMRNGDDAERLPERVRNEAWVVVPDASGTSTTHLVVRGASARRPARPWRPAAPPASTSVSLLRFFPSVRPDSSLRPPFSWPSSRAASPRRRMRRTAGRRRPHAQAHGSGAAQAVGGATEGGEERGQGQGATAQEGSWPARSCIGVPSCSRRRPGTRL